MIVDNKVLREDYLKKLRSGKDRTNIIKIITGMRRSGKSTLMMQFINELKASGVNEERILHLNLESKEFDSVVDFKDLNTVISSNVNTKERVYIFLDEIQRIKEWERTANSLMVDYDADIYITGSNAFLLSSELATYLSGRYVEIRMLPLSFKEYIELYPLSMEKNIDNRFMDYLTYGALPIVDPDGGDEGFINDQIEGVYNTVLIKDVQSRLKPKDVNDLEAVARYLYSNIGNLTNTLNISKSSGITSSTIKSYTGALEDAYLFYKVYRFDVKGKRILRSTEKYYASDVGIRNTILGGGLSDVGRVLENVVFLELIRRGYRVTVGSYKDREVDFIAQRSDILEYYQVTESLIFTSTAKREISSLDGVNDNYPKIILSMDRILENPGNGIKHLNVVDWLLEKV